MNGKVMPSISNVCSYFNSSDDMPERDQRLQAGLLLQNLGNGSDTGDIELGEIKVKDIISLLRWSRKSKVNCLFGRLSS